MDLLNITMETAYLIRIFPCRI